MSSQNMSSHINELRNFQAIITKKLLNKFGIYDKEAIDEWGWFIDPEINYYKPQLIKYISIPTTIQEENSKFRSIKSIKSINHFTNELVFNEQTDSTSYYIKLVKLITVLSLVYILTVI
jgi:hypothetical protein